MTEEISREQLADYIATRLKSDMEDHGGIPEFFEKLQAHPDQYISDLAWGAIDCIDLSGCLSPRVI